MHTSCAVYPPSASSAAAASAAAAAAPPPRAVLAALAVGAVLAARLRSISAWPLEGTLGRLGKALTATCRRVLG